MRPFIDSWIIAEDHRKSRFAQEERDVFVQAGFPRLHLAGEEKFIVVRGQGRVARPLGRKFQFVGLHRAERRPEAHDLLRPQCEVEPGRDSAVHDMVHPVILGLDDPQYRLGEVLDIGQRTELIADHVERRRFLIRGQELWKTVKLNDYVIGDFMWTGIDYLGEAFWPFKHAPAGAIDICGFPKDAYYFYKSQWCNEPIIHLFPHWNWPDRIGQVIPVFCYTNCTEVELFVNGKSFGAKRIEFPRQGNSGAWNRYDHPRVHPTTTDLFLTWDVPYEPGIVKAVGKRNGNIVYTHEIRTTGEPVAIRILVDRSVINADERDLAHLTVKIVDEAGYVVPTANNLVQFSVTGAGRLIGVDNGDPRDHHSYLLDERKAFNGLCLAIVRSNGTEGKIRVSARSDGLKQAIVHFEAKK